MRLQIKVIQEMNTKTKSNYTTTSDKTYNSLGVHNVCLSAEQNRPAVFLRAVGGPTSKWNLKGEGTWERPWDVYTARKEPGGPTATRVSERRLLQPLQPPSEPLGGEKFIFPPSHYCQRKARPPNKWLGWIGGVNEAWGTLESVL